MTVSEQLDVPADEQASAARLANPRMGAVSHGIVRVVAVMAAVSDGTPCGVTISSLTPVSFEPPMMLVALQQSSRMLGILANGVGFGLSILAADQQDIAQQFARRLRPVGADRFAGVGYRVGALTGAPLLRDAIGWLECRTVDIADTGDHALVIGEVLDESRNSATSFDPLMHGPDGYRRLLRSRPNARHQQPATETEVQGEQR
jgi:flavin reductase ActVB